MVVAVLNRLKMDSEPEELQSLNVAGIVKECFKLLGRYSKLFAALAGTLILPLCFAMLAHNLVTLPLMEKVQQRQDMVFQENGTRAAIQDRKELNWERSKLLLIFAAYLIFVLAFSLLSTAAVVYSVACIYSGRALSYVKVLRVVPIVWRRLLVTFIWAFLMMTVYNMVGFLALVLVLICLGNVNPVVFSLLTWLAVILFVVILIYLSCIWHLASVISVLEESYGLAAMRKSVRLMKGKRLVAFGLLSVYFLFAFFIGGFFNILVVQTTVSLPRIGYGILLILLLSFVNLLGMLVQSVFYFTCKAYHHESIDKLALSEHLGFYSGEYVPLKSSIQMEPFEP